MPTLSLLEILWWLAVGHIVSDFVLQTDFMARYKSPKAEPIAAAGPWWLWLGAHGMMNGAVTAFILGAWWVGPIEAVHHALTDWCKCTGRISFWQDQISHAVVKLALLTWMYT